MPFDFKALLTAPLDPDLQMEKDDLAWAAYGRAVHKHLMSERYVTAVNEAVMSAAGSAQPVHHIAARVRAFIVTGTITK